MKYRIGCILLLLTLCTTIRADKMEQRYQEVRELYTTREKTAQQELKQYLQDYPYTTYRSDVQLMIGVLQTEKQKYKQANKTLAKVVVKDLPRDEQPMYYFYRGYNYIQTGDIKQATTCFRTLKDTKNPYTIQGKYYYAYCLYSQGEYQKALPSFLEIEKTAQYHQIVPYYVIQIYYAQRNYEEVYQRAEDLLKRNPNNENNAEVHRILGELYYAKGDYKQAVDHLSAYEKACKEQKKDMLRNDLYLLGVSSYQQKDYDKAIASLKSVKQEKDSISESTCLHLGHAYVKTEQLEKAKLAYSAAMAFNITPALREEAMYNYALTTYQSSTALGESATAFNDFLKAYPQTKHATQVYQLLASVYMSCKNYKAALEAVNAIPEQTAKVAKIREYLQYQIGVDAFLQGKMQDCETWMTTVIDNEPNTSVYKTDAYYYRAEARYRLRKYEQCYNDLRRFVAEPTRSTNRPMADYLMGYAQFSMKQYSEAEIAFRRFVESAEGSTAAYTDALNRIGDCCFNNRAFTDAITAYQQVVEQKGSGADYATFQMGYAKGLLRKYSEKAELMERLVTDYPKSDYADDALYEIARARLQEDKNEEAINAYSRLIERYPNSNLARKSSLEQGMIYRNIHRYDEAIKALQTTVEKYPSTEEAYSALDALEQIYVETNRVSDYLAYTKQLGRMHMTTSSQEDSLTYVTAELQYMMGNYKDAAAGLTTYLSKFCAGGRYCSMAAYYAADSYYRLNQKDAALEMYTMLQEIPGNPYAEETAEKMAELLYDKQDYSAAREQFKHLSTLADKPQDRILARLGELRCSYYLQDDEATVQTASLILEEETTDEIKEEAMYNRAKVYYRRGQYGNAVQDLIALSQNVRIETGAEASYLLADCYYHLNALESAETEIMRFAASKSQQQYWLAKSLILLSDINVTRGDLFQAKQYLLSLQNNYKQQDDIQSQVADHLSAIIAKENADKVVPENETEDEPETEEEEEL